MNIPITQNEWHGVRNHEHWPIELFYSFYKEKGGYINNQVEFENAFTRICTQMPHVITNHGIFMGVTHETAILKMFKHYDNKFGKYPGDTTTGSS